MGNFRILAAAQRKKIAAAIFHRGRARPGVFAWAMLQPLQDQPARDRFIIELGQNFCVSAGAGVGKTTAIVQRIGQIALEKPEWLSRLVVVTYTKAAAEELRVRARSLVLDGLGASAHRRQSLISELRRAFFGTIHSFCLKLVREQGRHLGLPQSFDLLEDDDQAELWARFCESTALDAIPLPAHVLRAVLRFLTFEDLLGLAQQINPGDAEKVLAEEFSADPPRLTFADALAASGKNAPQRTLENQKKLREWLAEFDSESDFLELPAFTTGSGAFKEAFARELNEFTAWLSDAAVRIAAQIALGFRDYRRDECLMTYADQIAWARQLVADPHILDRLRARDFIIILDEAQDTDADMFSVLAEIVRPRGALGRRMAAKQGRKRAGARSLLFRGR